MAFVDNVLALQDGEIVSQGTLNDVLHSDKYVRDVDSEVFYDHAASQPQEGESYSMVARKEVSKLSDPGRKKSELATYTYYFASSGWYLLLGNVLSVTFWMFLTEFSSTFIPSFF